VICIANSAGVVVIVIDIIVVVNGVFDSFSSFAVLRRLSQQ
jgi:hypothetical protein